MKAVVLVTGASRGIGREIARRFALDGYRVVINYHEHAAAAEDLVQELKAAGCEALAIKADVSDRSQVDAMVAVIRRTYGPIGILINNAGIAQQKLFSDVSEAEWDRMFAINVKGVFHCCQSVLPDMIHMKAGRIINISSVWGLTGASCEVAYSAAKAAVIGFTKALAKELGQSGIQVNCVAPGVIDTDMNAELDDEARQNLKDQTPLGMIGSTADIAHMVLFLASEQASFMTGQVISPNGGFLI